MSVATKKWRISAENLWRISRENEIDVLYREIYNLGRNCEGNLSTNENSGKQPKIENSIFNENITGKDG